MLGFLGDIASGLLGLKGQEDTNVANAQQAQMQMEFQERMSGSAHQREVADLRAAGLNPILSGRGGPGASSPPGAQAQMHNAAAAGLEGYHRASSARMMRDQMINLREQTKQIREDTNLKTQQAWQSSATTEREKRAGDLLMQQYESERHNTDAAKHHAEILSHSAKGAKLEGDIDTTKYGEIMRYLDRMMKSLTGGSSAIRNIKP